MTQENLGLVRLTAQTASASSAAGDYVPSDADIPMSWDAYITEVRRTAAPSDGELRLVTCALGLCGESGEVADLIKKWFAHGHDLALEHLKGELGDVLWYWTLLVSELGLNPADVMEANVAKLRRRYPLGFDAARSREREQSREGNAE